ncbi:hypothetical protein [Marinomonas mediterranea]|jgi:hypothetical protein|uniref:Uncharacterized protein n=1 Tax=Marinomonas mediterranea (strain ATCC 700492 / JCM 21426 / NBRC 103028 / MMB-1) TaxID=717774 RepID=F2K3S9_MARM1|nr:hypothetical protein [Marinomonas mediterranea]ADZ90178.1 hypothetical protein Marme_0903 [Marinomonas mediterranea MMB-1]WCN08239.1 hypothetical protein GV055_04560 [Marinomonas mediterranea]WCN16377.1 hypothetical protein GV053_04565 [Marinomonas mediterranea MMB-1]
MMSNDASAAVTSLETAANGLISQLNALSSPVESLQTGLEAMQGAFPISSLLATQLDDIDTIFTSIVDIFTFLDSIKVLGDVFEEASATISTQQGQIHEIQTGLPDLKNQIESIAAKVTASESELPDPKTITTSVATVNSWIHGANSLLATLTGLQSKVSKGEQTTALSQIMASFVSDCDTLTKKVSTLSSNCASIHSDVQGILTCMVHFGNALSPIASNSNLIASSSMAHLNSTASKLKMINAILNPISIVLDVSGCTDPASKMSYTSALNGVKHSFTTQASGIASDVTVAINAFVSATSSGFIPLLPLVNHLNQAQQTFNSEAISAINGHIASLSQDMKSVNEALQAPPYTTVVNGKNAPGTFMAAENISALTKLLKSVSK